MCLMLHMVQRIGQSQPLLLPTLRFKLLLLALVCNNLHLIAYLCHQFSLVGSLLLIVRFSQCTNSLQFLINYYYNNHFTALHLGLPGWAGTRTNTHPPPSWSSSSLYQLLPSTTIHSILLVQITCLAIFLHVDEKFVYFWQIFCDLYYIMLHFL